MMKHLLAMKDWLSNLIFIVSLLFILPLAIAAEDLEKSLARVLAQDRTDFIQQEKVAVIVGLSDYPSHGGLSQLEYADKDAQAVGKQLEALGYRVRVLTNHQATVGAVLRVLDDLGQYLEPDQGTFLFYFSGHGFAQGKTNYLATYESDPDTIQHTGLSLTSVIERIQATGAKRQVLLIDACRNEPNVSGKAVSNVNRSFTDFNLAEGSQILFSTKFGGKSYEYSRLGHGVFSYYVLKGLEGDARQVDGLLSFDDLAKYVSDNVKDFGFKANRSQVPFVAGERYGDILLHAIKTKPKPPPEPVQQVALDVSIPDLGTGVTPVITKTRPKKRPWYKNPWVWMGVFAGGGTAYYISNQGSDSTEDRDVVIK